MGVSRKVDEMNSEKWVIGGIELQTPLKPILIRSSDGEEDEYSTTPTYAESRIPSRLACPPAPKKRKPVSSKCCHYPTEFFSPPDLETVFIRLQAP